MLIDFFFTLRAAKLKVSVKEYLTLLEAIEAGVIDDGDEGPSIDRFYYLARTSLVKDEAQYDNGQNGHHGDGKRRSGEHPAADHPAGEK